MTKPSSSPSSPPARGRRGASPSHDRARRRSLGARASALLHTLGPGVITGAADDDPSGISTYSQAGAAFGFGLLWTALVSLPLMAAVQLMCARIGLVADRGLASVLRKHYPPWLLWLACALLLVANTVNIADDLSGMAAATQLLTGVPAPWFVPIFAAIVLLFLVFSSYERMSHALKWLTLVLFAYVGAAALAQPHWPAVLRGTFLPHIERSGRYLLTVVAILGTTISPYLFFWQAAQEVENHRANNSGRSAPVHPSLRRELRAARADVLTGMLFSNVIMYFIILTAGATLHPAGHTTIQTAAEAATALRPLAGEASALLFTAGLVGTGLLGVPVLAGSAAYAVAEAAAWRRGMDEPPRRARNFYGVIAAAVLIGTALTLTGFDAIGLLFWAAVINGLLAPPLIVLILVICNDATIMGRYRNDWRLNALGLIAAIVMIGAAGALVLSWL